MITRAERERRLFHIRGALVDLRNSYLDRPWWLISVRFSKRFALAEEALRMLDAMIHTERMAGAAVGQEGGGR